MGLFFSFISGIINLKNFTITLLVVSLLAILSYSFVQIYWWWVFPVFSLLCLMVLFNVYIKRKEWKDYLRRKREGGYWNNF